MKMIQCGVEERGNITKSKTERQEETYIRRRKYGKIEEQEQEQEEEEKNEKKK